MKNIIQINETNNCEVEMVYSQNDGTDKLILDIRSDPSKNPNLEIGGGVYALSSVDEYDVPQSLFIGSGTLTFKITDTTGTYTFYITKTSVANGTVKIRKIDNFNYELDYVKKIATNEELEHAINLVKQNYLPRDGSLPMTGIFRVSNIKSYPEFSGISNSDVVFIPKVPYELIDPTHNDYDYFKGLLKWICANYPNRGSTIYIGETAPNSVGAVIIHIYSTSGVNSEGLPKYSTGTYFPLNESYIYRFITANYAFSFASFGANPILKTHTQAFRNITVPTSHTGLHYIVGTIPDQIDYNHIMATSVVYGTSYVGILEIVVESDRNVYMYMKENPPAGNGKIGFNLRYLYY